MGDRAAMEAFAAATLEMSRRARQRKFYEVFPEETVYAPDGSVAVTGEGENAVPLWSRHLYPRQMEFFEASSRYRELAFQAANRVGKTVAGVFAQTNWLTGDYRPWWPGRRFEGPVKIWAAGKSNETTRDMLQMALLGPVVGSGPNKGVEGTGMVPGRLIGKISWKSGVSDLVDTVKIRHVSGMWSSLSFKSYEQGRGAFEGTAVHVVHLDEEPDMDVYGECITRTATTGGLIMLTYTPLLGISNTVKQFMPQAAA